MSPLEALFVILAALFLTAVARWVLQWLYGHTLRDLLTDHDNPAIGLAVAGYLFGVVWTIAVLLSAPSRGLWQDVLDVLLYGGVGIVLLTAVALGTCRVFLGMPVRPQLEARNVAAAVVVAAVYAATSLTYSGALSGEGGGFGILLLFFVLGQLALLGVTYVFRWLTGYDDVREIAAGNLATGLALAGLLVGVGIVVAWAVSGDYLGLGESLLHFLLALAFVALFYPVRQVVVQTLLLGGPLRWRGSLLDEEVARDRNVAAGFMEAVAYVATALFLTFMF
ncbi:MAG: hypothetical protein KatS3mg131_3347 [Candidatus Tectimicrobiota bacterium]|nr:MAG: hypothetical protein KatS3mg131_3347 [Candidatus Tectomicrobia bacterium]